MRLNTEDIHNIAVEVAKVMKNAQTGNVNQSGERHEESSAASTPVQREGMGERKNTIATMPLEGKGEYPKSKECTYKHFMSCKPQSFDGRKGVLEAQDWLNRMESVLDICECDDRNKVRFAVHMFEAEALHWWNIVVRTEGKEKVKEMKWEEFIHKFLAKYCPPSETEQLEVEFFQLKMGNKTYREYVSRFNDISRLVSYLALIEEQLINKFIWGLPSEMRVFIKSKSPKTFAETVEAGVVMAAEMILRQAESPAPKRKWEERKGDTRNNNFKRPKTFPQCQICKRFHTGECRFPCPNCKKTGHALQECKEKKKCFKCGDPNHMRSECPELKRNDRTQPNQPKGRAFVLTTEEAKTNTDVITGTYLVNDVYARVLFDTGANRSLVSTTFRPYLNQASQTLDHAFTVEMADGSQREIVDIVKNCKISLNNHVIPIDLMPMELREFDIVIGMDWLTPYHAKVICDKRIVRLRLPNGKQLTVSGDRTDKTKNLITIAQAHKCLRKGYVAFLAYVVNTTEKQKVEDVPVVREYPEVFPDELPGLPSDRQVEFRIDLVPDSNVL
ncbi:uncharacterized protein LOC110931165 [Helianthus annuus]|uniref:uncharacterized protein LOC110931165 n=1 Tax=Helianthus annuus TaxID=4232 RepID=UPI000B8FFB17|nr:uncharacterized protein LOC110931165 [Helianthus annuus]